MCRLISFSYNAHLGMKSSRNLFVFYLILSVHHSKSSSKIIMVVYNLTPFVHQKLIKYEKCVVIPFKSNLFCLNSRIVDDVDFVSGHEVPRRGKWHIESKCSLAGTQKRTKCYLNTYRDWEQHMLAQHDDSRNPKYASVPILHIWFCATQIYVN